MAPKPLTLFVFIATTGNRFFKAVADRHQTASLPELSCQSRLQAPSAQLLGKTALVCLAPVASVFGAQIIGQSDPASTSLASLEIAKEVCLAVSLMLLGYWLLKQFLAHWRQVDSSAMQPTKGACYADPSPHNGLSTLSPWRLWDFMACPWQFARRRIQRRRLYLHAVATRLEGIMLPAAFSCRGTVSPLDARLPRASGPGSHGLHDFHEAMPHGFLMPTEVAACRSPPEVTLALQRLLADRWWELEEPQPMLETVPEDECLMMEESTGAEAADLVACCP